MGKWKTVAQVATYPIVHPQKTARAALGAGKTGLVAGAAGYVGWEKLTTDKSVARIASEAVIGERATDGLSNTVNGASDMLGEASEKLGEATAALGNAGKGINGISNFLGNLLNGGAGNMFSNFFGNLTSGKVSGMGLFGLVGAALLVFGRTGWFGKMAGALLAMLVIGGNSQSRQQESRQSSAYSRASVYSPEGDPGRVFVKAWDKEGRELPAVEMAREHYEQLAGQRLSPMQIYARQAAGIIQIDTQRTGLTR